MAGKQPTLICLMLLDIHIVEQHKHNTRLSHWMSVGIVGLIEAVVHSQPSESSCRASERTRSAAFSPIRERSCTVRMAHSTPLRTLLAVGSPTRRAADRTQRTCGAHIPTT